VRAAFSTMLSKRLASRASISIRAGDPWQSPIAGYRGEAARLRFSTSSTSTREKPAERSSAAVTAASPCPCGVRLMNCGGSSGKASSIAAWTMRGISL